MLFIPKKPCAWVQSMVPEKRLMLWDGYCPVAQHHYTADVAAAKAAHPGAKVALHPECPADALALADTIGSTKEIIDFCLAETGPVIIGTERGVADNLLLAHPERELYYLCPEKLLCPDMKRTSVADVYACLRGEAGEVIELDEDIRLAPTLCGRRCCVRGMTTEKPWRTA
jgi:quinolinate synthase